ncbi:MAG: VCBS repeat-containing protein, partial [Acidobacteriota bacterium]|nr:VCBS repeat-containing protein [Acidobacteriota bacterium]
MMRGRRVFRAIVWMVLACAASLAAEQHRNRLTGQKPKARVLHPAPGPAPAVPAVFTAAIRANNIGLALMDRHEFTQALGRFQTACVMNPASDTGCLNMGIALLHMGRLSEAHDILGKSAQRDPNNPRAWFNLGLVERAAGNDRVAVENFEKAAALDPNDPAIHYAIGEYYLNAQQYQQAISSFRKALDLDPFNLPSEFGLAQAELRTGDINGSLEHLRHAEHLTETGLGRPASDDYGEQGQYSFVQEMLAPPQPASPPIPVHFINVTEASGLPWRMALPKIPPRARGRRAKAGPQGAELQGPVALPKFLGSGACAFDYNNDGLPDLFLADADGTGHSALYRNAGHGRFVDATKSAKLVVSGAALGCATGDYDNDGYIDLAVSLAEGVQLFHNNGDGTFSDVTDSARLNARGLVLGLAFADYNGDGNLDLLATRFANFPLADASQPFSFPADAHGPGNVLWRGSGRDQFTDETKQAALAGTAPSVGALACDVNNDGAIDFVVTGWAVSPTIYLNQREGAFRAVMPWATEMPGPAAGGVGLDFDHDGWMDLAFTHWSSPGLTLWRNVGGKWFERVRLPGPLWMRGWGIAAVDYDHDGWVDLVAVGEDFSGTGRIILLRNQG